MKKITYEVKAPFIVFDNSKPVLIPAGTIFYLIVEKEGKKESYYKCDKVSNRFTQKFFEDNSNIFQKHVEEIHDIDINLVYRLVIKNNITGELFIRYPMVNELNIIQLLGKNYEVVSIDQCLGKYKDGKYAFSYDEIKDSEGTKSILLYKNLLIGPEIYFVPLNTNIDLSKYEFTRISYLDDVKQEKKVKPSVNYIPVNKDLNQKKTCKKDKSTRVGVGGKNIDIPEIFTYKITIS